MFNQPIHSFSNAIEAIQNVCNTINTQKNQPNNTHTTAIIIEDPWYQWLAAQQLTAKGISVNPHPLQAVQQLPLTKILLRFLQYFSTENQQPYSGDERLIELLHFSEYQIPSNEIAALAIEWNAKKGRQKNHALRQYLYTQTHQPAKDLFDTGLHPQLKKCYLHLETFIEKSKTLSTSQLLQALLNSWPFENMLTFSILNNTLQAYILAIEACFYSTSNNTEEQQEQPFEKVWLTTLHQLPDFKIDHCFIPILNEFYTNNQGAHPNDEIKHFSEVLFTLLQQPDTQFHLTLLDKPDSEATHAIHAIGLQFKLVNKQLLQPIIQKFALSVSALNSYLDCSIRFYMEYILRLSSGKNASTEMGNAIHSALETLFRNMLQHPSKQFNTLENFILMFKQMLLERKDSFSNYEFEKRLTHGINILTQYYNAHIHQWNKVVAIERNIGGVTLYHVPLKGKIDKLEFNGNEVTVVDYKSGNVEKALQKTMPPSPSMPNGGDYWRQAIFYKILIDQYQQKDWKVKNVCFDFIEPKANGTFQKTSILLDESSINTVQQQIVHVWERIQANDFFTGCGKRNCYWCSITSTHANK